MDPISGAERGRYLARGCLTSSLVLYRMSKVQVKLLIPVIRQLLFECFPNDDWGDAAEESNSDFISTICGFHDEEQCQFLVLAEAPPPSDDDLGKKSPNDGALGLSVGFKAVGFAILTPYHNAVYVASLCVKASHRGRGLATQLLFEAQTLAWEWRLPAVTRSSSEDKHKS